ncbi:hypothetical protein [Laspinema olomoucense]|uniref:hypothetical protein n=1 Tax=Laspinema olomoucense TaxID=3231600 RepID=UPI0021BB9D15|nr:MULTISPECIES: hypothetical protein [unclassified Laspinema]MCT7975266.1 hypothetical protein [Laspinema sp. D3d]MCT7996129.1 hypothetical protein [Laspinema sp. D3c]
MGLTISYDFNLGINSIELAREKIHALHQAAVNLPFEKVSEVVELVGEECQYQRNKPEDIHRFLKLEAARGIEYENAYFFVDAVQLIAFTVWPGQGCECANFGLALFPETTEVKLRKPEPGAGRQEIKPWGWEDFQRSIEEKRTGKIDETKVGILTIPTNLPPWSWSNFCKTQYASNPEYGGMKNFLKCHGLVIQMLDIAQELGILESVHDEGGYWNSRNSQNLSQSVGNYNALVAGVVGGLKTLFTQEGIEAQTQAPITDYPNYEYLEAEGEQQLKGDKARE